MGVSTVERNADEQSVREEKDRDTRWWQAVVDRDARLDGSFYYSVETTGVFCRPSCPSRQPRRAHVAFHPTAEAALQAGFRPCRRCVPDGPSRQEERARTVAALCRWIEETDARLSTEALAARAGWSVSHTHRVFKEVTGVTPRTYFASVRADRARGALAEGRSVTEAIHRAGYSSSSRFYAAATESLGMAPSIFRAGGDATEVRFAVGETSLGCVLVAATPIGLCGVSLGDDPDELVAALQQRFPSATLQPHNTDFDALVGAVIGLVDDPTLGTHLPLDIRGTAFQVRVWEALRRIPAGETWTYSQLAEAIGTPRAVRAVARACATNPIAVAIPCHRIVRKDGGLGGYRWGVSRKEALLRREKEMP